MPDWSWFVLSFVIGSSTGLPAAIGTVGIHRELMRVAPSQARDDIWPEVVFLIGWPLLALVSIWRIGSLFLV